MPEGVKAIDPEQAKLLKAAGVSDDEIKIIEAWRFITWGVIRCFKKDKKLSGRIEISSTY
jgi:hypothetical protein